MILVCGEALFDMFAAETADGFTFEARAAGSPFNVAVGLSRLGAEAGLCTGVSIDFLGDKLVARLAEEGVATTYLSRMDRPTTTAYVSLGPDGSATYAFYGEGAADRSLPLGTDIDLTGVTALHFGSYSFVVGETADLYLATMKRAAGSAFISYDPNIRPTVEPDMAVWRQRQAAAAPHCDLIKMSDEDAGFLFPGAALDDIAARLLNEGAGAVAFTLGAEGAVIHAPGLRETAAPKAIEVVDTVGAGDSFQAAFLAKLLTGRSAGAGVPSHEALCEAMRYGVAASAVTCSRAGADLPRAADMSA